jgi:hypothetical protein
MTLTRVAVPLLFLTGSLLASRTALGQIQAAPRDPYLAAREREEQVEQEKRNRERERERRSPRPSGCSTGAMCAPREAGIQSHPVAGTGLVAVLHDVDVDEDALNVRLRFFNDGAEPVTLTIDPQSSYEAYFVAVGGERRFILRDDGGSLQAKRPLSREIQPGSMESWWAKFPPLPPDAGAFDVVIPPAPPFEAVSRLAD